MAPTLRLRVPSKESVARKGRGMEDGASGPGQTARPALLSFDEMPEWFQHENNQWILHGYRPISGSFRASFRSWWYIHNETVNIYSHLVPAVVFLVGECYILRHLAGKSSRFTSTDLVAFSSFMLTASICFTFSALYHTFMNHSYAVDHLCHRLDMLGIGIFIVGDIILGVHIIFWCETTLRNIYWSMVRLGSNTIFVGQWIVVFGALTIITNIHPKLQSHKYRSMRTLVFVATGTSVVAPLIQGLDKFGLDLMSKKALIYTLVAKIGCLLSGTALYAMRFPERWWPGWFDMCSSHSFMHILVVSAAVIQLIGYLQAFDYAYLNITCLAS
ncbi:hemolysin-III related-domain-containing protein [Microdochium trichocladiopsis]|uniref:Hemolysin-III related-domain-containing protein n=1 Tax=Microdochium trichocladiopsis TaxID=1682393 RepID=A0A9P9BKU3_9PEZI|nr:hemolysin-III related-domain-containing protein [Microdochium trichocladiopsis]KAH7021614.1 hemolysin-III related-domain-containing protein [Microdochium trichocladiopsis]